MSYTERSKLKELVAMWLRTKVEERQILIDPDYHRIWVSPIINDKLAKACLIHFDPWPWADVLPVTRITASTVDRLFSKKLDATDPNFFNDLEEILIDFKLMEKE